MIEILPNWHPIFVHFTVALLTLACLLHVASLLVTSVQMKTQLAIVAQWNLWIGSVITLVTVGAGWYAYNTVDHDNASHLMMTQHRNIAMVTFVIFIVLASWSFIRYRKGVAINWLLTFLLVLATGALATTAWYGGEIVYRHGLGVMSLPQADEHQHSDGHHHDHDHAISNQEHSHESMEHSHDSLDDAEQTDEHEAHDPNITDDAMHTHEGEHQHSNIDTAPAIEAAPEQGHDHDDHSDHPH